MVYNSLLSLARAEYEQHIDHILSEISKGSNSDFRIIELDESALALYVPSTTKSVNFQVGFPFKLISESHQSIFPGEISICVYGEPVRSIQRLLLQSALHKPLEVISAERMQEMTENLVNQAGNIQYASPYTYRGDNFISEYFFEQFVSRFGITIDRKYSHLYRELAFLGYTQYSKDSMCTHTDSQTVLIMPDLIDTHCESTLEMLTKLNPLGTIIPGRDILIQDKIYWTGKPDFLLRDRNVDLYMDQCLVPFVGQISPQFRKMKPPSLESVMVNLFSSQEVRNLSRDQAYLLFERLLHSTRKIFLSQGDPRQASDARLIAELYDHNHSLMSNVTLVESKTLSDLAVFTEREKITAAISPDTSIPHLMGRLRVPTIVFTLPRQFDSTSLQSVISNSPVGFSRLTQPQFPVYLSEDNQEETISEACDLLEGNTNVNRNLFSPEVFLKNIRGVNDATRASVLDNNPSFKIARFK